MAGPTPREALLGAALGCMCGDALGMPVEGWSAARIKADYGRLRTMEHGRLPAGSYTDDSRMMIAILDSLRACRGHFDPQATASSFAALHQPWRGYGARIDGVMAALKAGAAWDTAGTDSWGNGGAMRVGVLGAWLAHDLSAVQRAALDQCRITHNHPRGLAGALAQAFAAAFAARLSRESEPCSDENFIYPIVEAVRSVDAHVAARLESMPALSGLSFEAAGAALGGVYACDVSAAEAVPPAIGAFIWACHGHGAADAVELAVSLGGDTDTIGAMSGALAGAYWGPGAWPEAWLAYLENGPWGRDAVISLCEAICSQLAIDEPPVC